MTPAYHTEAVLSEDGKLSLDHLPFRASQIVEVIVLPINRTTPGDHSLKGTVIRYDRPFDPVAEDDWSTMQ